MYRWLDLSIHKFIVVDFEDWKHIVDFEKNWKINSNLSKFSNQFFFVKATKVSERGRLKSHIYIKTRGNILFDN